MIRDPLDVFLGDFSEGEDLVFEWQTGEDDDDNPIIVTTTVRAIFDNAFVDTATGEIVLDTTAPRLTAKATDVAAIPREAVVTIRERVYSVVQIQPDGTGFAMVQLAHEE
jgi:hypothetical protein